MNNKPLISYKRHIAKTITWRIFSSVITYFLAYFLFRYEVNASQMAFWVVILEGVLKMFFYYIHERVWYKLTFSIEISARLRHFFKTISYRFFGSLFTFLVTIYIFKENVGVVNIVSRLVMLEILCKLFLYYFHERVWYRINFGVIKKTNGLN